MVSGEEDLRNQRSELLGPMSGDRWGAYSVKEVNTCLADQERSSQEVQDEVRFSEDKRDRSDER